MNKIDINVSDFQEFNNNQASGSKKIEKDGSERNNDENFDNKSFQSEFRLP